MTYSYSGDPSNSELDQYRFLVGDTGAIAEDATPIEDATPTEDFILADEEIQFILNTYTAHNTRMYYLFNSAANKLAKEIKRSLGPQMEDPTSRTDFYKEQAQYYRKLNALASGLSLPSYSCDKIFTKGMHYNV